MKNGVLEEAPWCGKPGAVCAAESGTPNHVQVHADPKQPHNDPLQLQDRAVPRKLTQQYPTVPKPHRDRGMQVPAAAGSGASTVVTAAEIRAALRR